MTAPIGRVIVKAGMTRHPGSHPSITPNAGVRSGLVMFGLLIGVLHIPQAVPEDDIYKIVDEKGNITYSSEPPAQGEAADVFQPPPEPPAEDVEAALKRQQKIEEKFDKLDQARAEQARVENRQRPNNTTVIQSNTVLGGGRPWLYGPYNRGAAVAPGAPTAPGYRPPGYRPPNYRPPGNRPRPPIAVPHSGSGP